MARRSTFPHSNVLILSLNSINSLLPATTISQAESFLEGHRIDDVIELADQHRKKLQSKLIVDQDEAEELQYVYQRIGFQLLSETRFEDAGYNLFEGNLDPRLLISYYPNLRGELLSADDDVELFSGVAEHIPPYDSIDDIIVANIVRNYSPHLAPNTRSAPPTAELRRILGDAARDMLDVFLRKWRRVHGEGADRSVHVIVDTVLAKLFAQAEKTTDLYALLEESADLVVEELEPVFKATGQYNALCRIYQKRGDDAKLLEVWSKLVEGEWTDTDIPDPLTDMFTLLTERRNRQLTQQWGVWLTKKDTERALKLLTSQGSGKRAQRTEADAEMLEQIRAANPEAGVQFLEHLVLQKKSTDPTLHTELAIIYVDQLLTYLQEESVSKLWRAKAASYTSNPTAQSYLSYFASTTPDSPAKRARMQAALFLQTSSLYDASAVRARIVPHERILAPELAIVEGKLGNDKAALALLAHTLRDHASAEAYCTTRSVLPPRAAASFAETLKLANWVLPVPAADADETRRLLRMLLGIYMADGDGNGDGARPAKGAAGHASAASNLLSSQAGNFDVVDVLELVPPDWPLPTLSAFLERSLRRTLHARHEALIVKGVSMGQNLAISDETHAILRDYGAVVEEALSPHSSAPSSPIDEKVGLHDADADVNPPVAEFPIPGHRKVTNGIDAGADVGNVPMSYGSSVTDAYDDSDGMR
ncbi:hypothetical protein DENSPDRAFT_841652 [Dentipellis sp. KUC8613]|nr:hypothetical protein DENSPDRAFT_841652 [Dentipellis sp. KUC8613]